MRIKNTPKLIFTLDIRASRVFFFRNNSHRLYKNGLLQKFSFLNKLVYLGNKSMVFSEVQIFTNK